MGIWDNVRADLRLRNLSVLSLLERTAHGYQDTNKEQLYMHNGSIHPP